MVFENCLLGRDAYRGRQTLFELRQGEVTGVTATITKAAGSPRSLYKRMCESSSTGFTGCGNSALVVILSEAKNLSRLKTKDQERFFAQTRRSERQFSTFFRSLFSQCD